MGALGAKATLPEWQASFQEVRQFIDRSIKYTRSLTFELSPPVLYELGFEGALDWLAAQIRENCDLEVEVEKASPPVALPEEVRTLLYLGVRELLTNVAKHAQARKARVSWERRGDRLQLRVADDGVGFDAAHRRGQGFGLFSLRERLERLGGGREVKSAKGQGRRSLSRSLEGRIGGPLGRPSPSPPNPP